MATLEHIARDIERAEERIAEWQGKLKELNARYTEAENLHIVAAVRSLKMTREELAAFIKDGTLPKSLQGQETMPASRYSRRKSEPEAADATDTTKTEANRITESEANHDDE